MTFQSWVDALIRVRFGTATALANAIGMRLSPFTRGVAGGTLNLVNLLKLAQVAEEHPSTVLRMARKGAEADLLEALYGSGHDALVASERDALSLLRAIEDPGDRAAVIAVARRFVELRREQVERSTQTPASATPAKGRGGRSRSRGR